jgi:hypothetical protein
MDPLQAPEAAQEVTFVEDHVNVALPPAATAPGSADKETVGVALVPLVGVTVVDFATLPPAPLQVSV